MEITNLPAVSCFTLFKFANRANAVSFHRARRVEIVHELEPHDELVGNPPEVTTFHTIGLGFTVTNVAGHSVTVSNGKGRSRTLTAVARVGSDFILRESGQVG